MHVVGIPKYEIPDVVGVLGDPAGLPARIVQTSRALAATLRSRDVPTELHGEEMQFQPPYRGWLVGRTSFEQPVVVESAGKRERSANSRTRVANQFFDAQLVLMPEGGLHLRGYERVDDPTRQETLVGPERHSFTALTVEQLEALAEQRRRTQRPEEHPLAQHFGPLQIAQHLNRFAHMHNYVELGR